MTHMRSIVYGRTAVVPFNAPSFTWNELVLETQTCGRWTSSITRSKFERTNLGSGERVIYL